MTIDSFDEGWTLFAHQAGEVLVEALSQAAPVGDPFRDPDSGTLAGSMEWVERDGTLQLVSMDYRGPIARYVVRGTRPHPIDPVNADFLHWTGDGGEDVYAKHVDHPGTAPNPFHIEAWERHRDEILAMYRDLVGHGSLAILNPWRNRTINI